MRPSPGRFAARAIADERGGIIMMVAVALVVVLASTGLAIDLGRGYVERLRLGRAVDAGSLAGARTLRLGQASAQSEALAVARINGLDAVAADVSTAVQFATNERGENTVTLTASRTIPTTFMKVLGHQDMQLSASATAAVPPIDMVLALDQSGSLALTGSWTELQNAALGFVNLFDDAIDQIGLVSFQVAAADRFLISHGFTAPITSAVQSMQSVGDTNMGEGLRLAMAQLQRPTVRATSAKAVVFFTDGRATAVRMPAGPPGNAADRILAVYGNETGSVRGYFDNPDQIPPDQVANPDGCIDWAVCFGFTEDMVRAEGQQAGLAVADQIRSQGIVIYVIALGNPNETDPLLQPNLAYLREIANEGGVADGSQPQGRMFFAPQASDLAQVFDLVAQDLLVRLAR